jgi:hypothetical protein
VTDPRAVAYALVYEHRLLRLGETFKSRGLAPVLVKGQAVADLVYPHDEPRVAADVDLLVAADEAAVASALRGLGYREQEHPDRSRSLLRFMGERSFFTRAPDLPPLVELHHFLDKVVARKVDYPAILARSGASGRPGFRYPTLEDLVLLVALHAALSVTNDPKMERDIHLLTTRGKPDLAVLSARARAWRLALAVERLDILPPDLSTKASVRLRRRLCENALTAHLPPTMRYLVEQLGWHDRAMTWALGLARYVVARVEDRLRPQR